MVWTQAQGGQACWPYAMARRLGERSDLPQGLPVDRVWPLGTEDSLQLHPGGPFTLQGSARTFWAGGGVGRPRDHPEQA